MSSSQTNPVIAFFASVQLALFLLFMLAATSIIGTVIPQNNPPQFYVDQFGSQAATFMQILDITDMYNSWWFLTLLLLFAINLIVCSLKRIPQVLTILRKDNLNTSVERLKKMGLSQTVPCPTACTPEKIAEAFDQSGWKTEQRQLKDGTLFFAQKGGWTRFGVYLVHLSILVILVGAVLGSSMFANSILHSPGFAFKGSIMLPESKQTDTIFSFKTGQPVPLGFSVRCNYFTIEYYPNGMPKTYLSRLTLLEDGQPVPGKEDVELKVNTPLRHNGVTFYQSSYQPYQDFVVSITKESTKEQDKENSLTTHAIIPPAQKKVWEEAGISYGIINREMRGNVARRIKVWLTDNQGQPSSFWLNLGQEAAVERPTGTYLFSAKQLYATGLQVTKDPGVWLVYAGCIAMLVGLYIAFFTSHRKLFAYLPDDKKNASLVIAGSANKNKVGFEKKLKQLVQSVTEKIDK